MLLSLFQRELVFSLSGKKTCLNENNNVWTCKELRKQKWKKKNWNSKILLLERCKRENLILRIEFNPPPSKSLSKRLLC